MSVDLDLIEEIAHRLRLRTPNRRAIETVVSATERHFAAPDAAAPFECIVESATGVGKTWVLAGLIDYYARTASPARNFLVLTPGRTILRKTIDNFTAGAEKSITADMPSRPFLITADNFDRAETFAAMQDPAITKVFVFTVQALTSATGDGRNTHDHQETLGTSLYKHLTGLDDLVVLADEHHLYQGPAFSRTIDELHPALVVGLTATPADEDRGKIVYSYSIARAVEDRYVKTPVLVARRDDRHDDRTKLLDGVTLLRHKAKAIEAYCAETGQQVIHPMMLVIAKNIAEADEFRDMIEAPTFDGGAWAGTTLIVHSGLPAREREEMLTRLSEVERPDSPIRVIISVGMLNEGWDVKNVYVIASMRVSASQVLTEQTLGRGLRLPFGTYTERQMLDTLEVLAHERYEALLRQREALNRDFVDSERYIEAHRNADGDVEIRDREVLVGAGGIPTPTVESPQVTSDPAPLPPQPLIVRDAEDVEKEAAEAVVDTADEPRTHKPLPERPPIQIPYTRPRIVTQPVSLNQIHDLRQFEDLGRVLTVEIDTDLRRTVLKRDETGHMVGVDAEDEVEAVAWDVPLETSRAGLIDKIFASGIVTLSAPERRRAIEIVDTLLAGMGEQAAGHLSAYFDRCARRLVERITAAVRATEGQRVSFDGETVEVVTLSKERLAARRHVTEHTETYTRGLAYNGWTRNLYAYAWFDSEPEYRVARAVDKSNDVVVWARLHRRDLPITWTMQGREYNPDFVVIEGNAAWLVEVKSDGGNTDPSEVAAKMDAAKTWAATVTNSGKVDHAWRYLLLRESDIRDASGSWDAMKALGR